MAAPIAAIVVLSFNRILQGRARSHIGIEVAELVPALAYRQPPAAIVLIGWATRILASLFHSNPNLIFRRVANSGRAAAYADSRTMYHRRIAAAGTGTARQQVFGPGGNKLAAVTLTQPIRMVMASLCRFTKYEETSKSLTCKIGPCAASLLTCIHSALVATARLGVSGTKMDLLDRSLIAAITKTEPVPAIAIMPSGCFRDYNQAVKPLPYEIKPNRIRGSHAVHPPVMNGFWSGSVKRLRALLACSYYER